jgi:hypothetical protein
MSLYSKTRQYFELCHPALITDQTQSDRKQKKYIGMSTDMTLRTEVVWIIQEFIITLEDHGLDLAFR